MKAFTILAAAFALFAPAVLAQAGVPTCAQSCVSTALLGSGCGANVNCICGNSTLISNLSCCVKSNCDAAEGEQAVSFANGICRQAGVTLPQSPSCAQATGGSSSGSSSAATASATSSSSSSSSSTRLGVLPPIRTGTSVSPEQSSFLGSLSSELSTATSGSATATSASESASSSSEASASSASSASSAAASSASSSSSRSSNAAPTPLARDVTGAMFGAAAAGIFGALL